MMTEHLPKPVSEDLALTGGLEWRPLTCTACDWSFVTAAGGEVLCPHCAQIVLVPAGEDPAPADVIAPEALVPFLVERQEVASAVSQFASRIPFAPSDLKPPTLLTRLRPLFFPRWLVDADVRARWQAEIGFNYQVISHEEIYTDKTHSWASREIQETRIRWQPRLGILNRQYHNVLAPAMEEDADRVRQLGDYDLTAIEPTQTTIATDAIIAVPNRSHDDVWPEAVAGLQKIAGEDCLRATQGDHIRQFSWQPEIGQANWTQLLLPIYATWYVDDEQVRRPVLINGQTGAISGIRRASMRRAQRWSLTLAMLAMLALFLGLGSSLGGYLLGHDRLQAAGILAALFGLVLVVVALIPIASAWFFNRIQGQRWRPFNRT